MSPRPPKPALPTVSATDPFADFHPVTSEWFKAVFDAPTTPQVAGWPVIARGESALILAPTGTGKTLAAFLWCLDRLMLHLPPTGQKGGCRIVYISPLKALAVDVERNLRSPLAGIANMARRMGVPFHDPSISVRTGDTPQNERARFRRDPADILITTPESLYLLLTSQSAEALRTVDTVIVDEIHALVPTKRGAHLALSLERLEALTQRPLQRIGLSATQRPLEEVARFLGGVEVNPTKFSAGSPLPPGPTNVPPIDTKNQSAENENESEDQLHDITNLEPDGTLVEIPTDQNIVPDVTDLPTDGALAPDIEERHKGEPGLNPHTNRPAHESAPVPEVNSRGIHLSGEGTGLKRNHAAMPEAPAPLELATELASSLAEVGSNSILPEPETTNSWSTDAFDTEPLRYRPVTIVNASAIKQLKLRIEVPVEDMARLNTMEEIPSGPASQTPRRVSIWTAIHPRLLELIRERNSTILFVNSRQVAERLAGALNELAGEPIVRAHHGSLASAQRSIIEEQLKAGQIRALCATSTLELGIDMGAVDLVIQIEAPPSVASGMQRIGRAGHHVNAVSEGILFPKYRADLVACAAVTRAMHEGHIESTRFPRNPLDVLAQQLVAIVSHPPGVVFAPASRPKKPKHGKSAIHVGTPSLRWLSGARVGDNSSPDETESEPSFAYRDAEPEQMPEVPVDDLYDLVRRAAPFGALSRSSFDGVLDLLSGRYPSDEFAELRPRLNWDRIRNVVTAREGAGRLAILNAGTIPDRGLYGVFLAHTEGKSVRVGELDEEMVFESHPG